MLLKLAHFKKVVTTAGTAVALTGSDIRVANATIQAEPDNTGYIYVGGSTVSSSSCAAVLSAGESIELSIDDYGSGATGWDLASLYIDSSVNGDGVFVGYSVAK